MGVATGLTAARMQQIIDQQILNGAVNLDGDLILERANGQTFNAGRVKGATGDPGDDGADAVIPDELSLLRLRIASGSDASLASTAHGLQIGDTAGVNLIVDNNELMARNNGAGSPLYVQNDGGDTFIGSTQSEITLRGRLRLLNGYKVFWTGASYFVETATINLSESVTTQPNGICLQWSRYSGGVAHDDTYGYTWIHKYHVINKPGAGVQCILQNGAANPLYKYVYINDNSITGNAQNDVAPANQMVLRAVFGW